MEETQNEDMKIDIEKLKKDLEEFVVIAKTEIKKINDLSVGIATKAEEIDLYYDTYKEARTRFDDNETGMRALLDKSINLKNEIQQIEGSTQAQVNQVTERANVVQTKIKEIETYHGVFAELKTKLSDPQTGLQALLSQATNFKSQVEQASVSAQASLKQITDKGASITTKVQEIEQYYTAIFLPLKAKVDDPKLGIQAILGGATTLKDEIVKTKAGTDENYREIKNLTDQSAKLKEQSEASHREIEELKKRSSEFKADIEQTFQIATDVSLANSFNERRKELQGESDKWLKNVEYSTLLLVVLVVGIFLSQYSGEQSVNDWRFWYRFIFTSPVIFYVYFASHNYNRTRDLLEKYAFKFATSLSLQSYTKLLTDNFKEEKHKEELLKFSLRSIDLIYKEPYVEKDKTRKFSVGNKIINIGVEDIETLTKKDISVTDLMNKSKEVKKDI